MGTKGLKFVISLNVKTSQKAAKTTLVMCSMLITIARSFKSHIEVEQDKHLNNIQDFIYSLRPDNTKKKTTYDLNIWRRYCSTVGETIKSLRKNSVMIQLVESRSLCGKPNEDQKRDKETATAGLLAQKPTPPIPKNLI